MEVSSLVDIVLANYDSCLQTDPLATLETTNLSTSRPVFIATVGCSFDPNNCVYVENELYMTAVDDNGRVKLLKFSTSSNHICKLETPSKWYGLTTYNSKPVLVGGKKEGVFKDTPCNELWTLNDRKKWVSSVLPPMPTARWSPSVVNAGTPECLVVAGGSGHCARDRIHKAAYLTGSFFESILSSGRSSHSGGSACAYVTKALIGRETGTERVVEVFRGSQWFTVSSVIPFKSAPESLSSVVLDGNYYVCGEGNIHYCAVDLLLTSNSAVVWHQLHTSDKYIHRIATFGSRLLSYSHSALGTGEVIHAYKSTSDRQAWVDLGMHYWRGGSLKFTSVVLPDTGDSLAFSWFMPTTVSLRGE